MLSELGYRRVDGTLKFISNPVIHGTVTGGTGAFQGATGTILGKSLTHCQANINQSNCPNTPQTSTTLSPSSPAAAAVSLSA